MVGLSTSDRTAPPERLAEPLEERVVTATLECIARWGIAKTTADDVARAAGISRATLYRVFPGGWDVMIDAVLRHEGKRLFATVTAELESAHTLEDRLVVGMVTTARFLADHEALSYVLAHEAERVIPALSFDRLGRALEVVTAFATPYLLPFVADRDTASRRAEMVARVLLSYAANPTPELPLTDEGAVRRFVVAYLIPTFSTSPSTAG